MELQKIYYQCCYFPLEVNFCSESSSRKSLEKTQNRINGNSIQIALSLGKSSWQTLHGTLHWARHSCSSPLVINGLCSHVTLPFYLDPEVTFSAYEKQWIWKTWFMPSVVFTGWSRIAREYMDESPRLAPHEASSVRYAYFPFISQLNAAYMCTFFIIVQYLFECQQ